MGFNLPDYHWKNICVNRPFRRVNVRAFRGESEHSGGGMAYYGRGIYSSQRKSYAAQYGKVRVVGMEELPYNPFRVKSAQAFDFLAGEYRRWFLESGGSMSTFNRQEGVIGWLKSKGFDGLTVGVAPDNVIVKWTDVR